MSRDPEFRENRQTEYHPGKKSSGSGTAILLIFVALLFIAGPFVLPQFTSMQISGTSQIILIGFGTVLLTVGAIILVITRLYVKASANEAFVKTGMGTRKAVIDGGSVVIPVIHEIIWVSLETMKLQVSRVGKDALLTADNLRANVHSEFFIRVQKKEEDVLQAATSLGNRCNNPDLIKQLVEEKLVSALRTVAATKTLQGLNAKRDEFAVAVQEIVQHDLKHNGLQLESVTISHLDQALPDKEAAENNVFDAQGLQIITQITQEAKVRRNQIEVDAAQKVKEQDVAKDRFIFGQEVARAEAEAAKGLSIKNAQAKAEREGDQFAAEQDKLSQIAKVLSEQAVQTESARRDQAVQQAQIAKDQAVQTANVMREQTVEVSRRNQQIAIAQAEKQRTNAEAERIEAETERTRKEQEKLTVEKQAEAERQKAVAVIAKESAARQTQIERQMQADVEAYAAVKEAEGEQNAAAARAQAQLTLANADQQSKTLEAQGKLAVESVPVQVAAKQVEVDQARVQVVRSELEAKSQNEKMAFDLQVALAQIEANKQVQIETAKAMGAGLAAANMTIYGDPNTFRQMADSFTNGQKAGQFVQGLVSSTPQNVTDLAMTTIGEFSGAVAAVAKNLFKKEVPAELIQSAVEAELAKRRTDGSKTAAD